MSMSFCMTLYPKYPVPAIKEPTDTELTSKLAQAQAELKATMDGLHNARIEIETIKEISEKAKKDKK